jgi:hypothetical protein
MANNKRFHRNTAVGSSMNGEDHERLKKITNIQAPSSKEAPTSNHRKRRASVLEFGFWNFSGAWMLVLGAFADASSQNHAATKSRVFIRELRPR